MTDREKKFRQYLLGALPEDEAETIDLQIIAGDDLTEELLFSEDELMEEYLDEELSAAETELFFTNFLISDDRKNRLEEIALLRKFAQRKTGETAVETENTDSDGFFTEFYRLFALNRRPSAAIAGVLIVALCGFLLWQFVFDKSAGELSVLENKTVELNKRDLGNLDEFTALAKLSLFAGNTRGAGEESGLRAADLTENVLLRLALPPEPVESEIFSVKIIRNGEDSIALDRIRAYGNQNGKELRLLAPASFLTKGVYKIEALPENDGKYPLVYSFKIN